MNIRIICQRVGEVFDIYGADTEIICPGCHEPMTFQPRLGVLRGNGAAEHEVIWTSEFGVDVIRDVVPL